MLKQSFVFTVSLIAMLVVGVDVATASIPSTGYVNTALEGKQQKLTTGQAGNLKGEGTVDVSIDDSGIITITGAQYELPYESVSTDYIANEAVTTEKIASGAVGTDKIADEAITTDKIANGAITEDKIASGAITDGHIGDNAISQGKIKDLRADLAARELLENKVSKRMRDDDPAGYSLTGDDADAKYPTIAYVETYIASGNLAKKDTVGTNEIANGAVTAAKIASGVIPTVNNATLTIKNGATNTDLATFTANSAAAATATIPAATPEVAGLAKYGLIPQGSATSTNYATIWVE